MPNVDAPLALAMVNNGISATMVRNAFQQDGYEIGQTVLVKQRRVNVPWADACKEVIEFTSAPSLTMLGQVNQIGFYRHLLKRIRPLLKAGTIRDIYFPNIDNLINNHIVQRKRLGRLAGNPRISVVAEGLMNYQNITQKDRAGWRWMIKPTLAAMMGLHYKQPAGHLSGAFEAEVQRIFAYSDVGLFAPADKVVVLPYPQVRPSVPPRQDTALVVMTGIAQWMTPEAFQHFKHGFATWLNAQNFRQIFTKAHPHYPSGGIEELLDRSEPLGDRRGLEEMAGEIPASTVIGYCTTGLVTLKLMRPDLHVVDWGSDYYCEHAYHGDRSVIAPLQGAGVQIVNMNDPSNIDEYIRANAMPHWASEA